MFVIKHKVKFFVFSAALVVLSLFSIGVWGINPSIEFTGGSITEITYVGDLPRIDEVRRAVSPLPFGDVLIQPTGEDGYIIRTKELSTEERGMLFSALSFGGDRDVEEKRYSLVGPSIGKELRTKAWIAISVVVVGIVLFIMFAFRKVSGEALTHLNTTLKSWHYSLAAIIALLHDIIIPTGIFAFLGSQFVDAQIDVLFVTALLAILGYSVNDTIVVFDRVRENLRKNQEYKIKKPFEETVGESLSQTYVRSVNTSLTTLFVLLALLFLGGSATVNFALVLAIGVLVGTYSSIFLAVPLLLVFGREYVRHNKKR